MLKRLSEESPLDDPTRKRYVFLGGLLKWLPRFRTQIHRWSGETIIGGGGIAEQTVQELPAPKPAPTNNENASALIRKTKENRPASRLGQHIDNLVRFRP